jgi:hypothetical protein
VDSGRFSRVDDKSPESEMEE